MSATVLQQRVKELIAQHGSLRAAARVLVCDPGYLSRLKSGDREWPEDLLLARMKLRRVVSYERTDGVQPAAAPSTRTVPVELLERAMVVLGRIGGPGARRVWCDLRDATSGVAATAKTAFNERNEGGA